MQRRRGDYADQPFIYALAWYLETDILILHTGLNKIYNVISSTLDYTINREKPPMILGLEQVHYQSFAPLDGAGMFLDQMEDRPVISNYKMSNTRMTEE